MKIKTNKMMIQEDEKEKEIKNEAEVVAGGRKGQQSNKAEYTLVHVESSGQDNHMPCLSFMS